MSIDRRLASAVASLLIAGAPAFAQTPPAPKPADPTATPPQNNAPASKDPCDAMVLSLKVPLYKAPQDVEGYNKVRISLLPTKDEKGAITLEVRGTAYYPDDVVIFLDVRHAKVPEYFMKEKVVVKNRAFAVKFPAMSKVVPGGGLTVEAWFILQAQSEAVKGLLQKDRWFHCDPPCDHDQRNVTRATWSNGGWDAQVEAEKQEKEQVAAARTDILNAQKECDAVLDKIAKKESATSAADAALAKLGEDLKAASESLSRWTKTRQFLLFAAKVSQVTSLKAHVNEAARARAAELGATVPDIDSSKAAAMAAKEAKTVTQLSDELRGFIDEKDSLDREWAQKGAEVVMRAAKDRYEEQQKQKKQDPQPTPK